MGNEAFIATLPEEYRANPTFQQYPDLGALLKSHVSLESMMGADKSLIFKLPKAGDYSEVYKTLGKPEAADKYEFPKELKVALPDGLKASLSKAAHEANMTQAQFEKMIQWNDAESFAAMESGKGAQTKKRADAKLAIQTEFGDAYSQRMNLAKDVMEAWGATGQAAYKALDEAGLLDNPAVVGFLSDIGSFAGEEGLVTGGGGGGFSLSPDAAKAEIARLQGDKEFLKKYMTKTDAGHKEANRKMDELYKIAYPE